MNNNEKINLTLRIELKDVPDLIKSRLVSDVNKINRVGRTLTGLALTDGDMSAPKKILELSEDLYSAYESIRDCSFVMSEFYKASVDIKEIKNLENIIQETVELEKTTEEAKEEEKKEENI